MQSSLVFWTAKIINESLILSPAVHYFEPPKWWCKKYLQAEMQWKSPSDVIYDDNKRGRHMILDKNIISPIWISVTTSASPVLEISRNDRNIQTPYQRAEAERDSAKSEQFHYPQHSRHQHPEKKVWYQQNRDAASKSKDANVTIK